MSSFDKSGSAVKASVAAGALAVALVLALQSPTLLAQPAVQGQWRTLSYLMPINPVHVTLTYDGKVLVVAGSGNVATETNFDAVVWNPDDDTFVTHALTWDMFCNGASVLPDGRVFINGGTLQYDPFFGERRSSAYDPATGLFSDLPLMADGRWYPTTTTLGNGSIMTFSGLKAAGGTNTTVEIYTPGAGWSAPVAAGWTPPLYPRMHLNTDGRVFYSGSGRASRFFNPATMTWSTVVATMNYGNSRTYGTSVLLPLTPANQYRPRVMIFGGSNPATNTTEIIDLSAPTPQWQFGPPMSQARIEMNATILPNGKVLAMGGSASDENAATASFNADLYDPATNTFSSAGVNAYPRLYHSGSLLLPDATVMLVGGNPTRGSYEQHIEIYSPAYLFNANGSPALRPTISGVPPGAFAYGQVFQVDTPDAANIASVVLVRPGSQTHAFDMDQRLVGMNFTVSNGRLNVTAPPHGNIAPPGYYMLFVLNTAGVPSVARFVQLGNPGQSLVAAYGFNEGTGTTLLDETGKGHTGAATGATWTAQGKFGSALTFDGVNDWVTVADANELDFTTGMTLEAWVYPTASGGGSWRNVVMKERAGGEIINLYSNADTNAPVAYAVGAAQPNLPLDARARRLAAQHLDPSRRDLRRDDAAVVRQRQPGREPGGHEPAADLDGRAPVRRQQRVGRVLRGPHR